MSAETRLRALATRTATEFKSVRQAISGRQPSSATLTTLAGTTPTANGLALLQVTVLSATDPAPTTPGIYLKMDS